MLLKKNRVVKKEVDEVFKNGFFLSFSNLTFKYMVKKDLKGPKISFVTPKSISKKAVIRNKLRRIGYRALKKHLKDFPTGLLGVFVFKKHEENLSLIENEIKKILHKIN